MKEFIDNVLSHLNWEEIVDFANTIIHDRYEILLIALAIIFIMVVCLSTLLERLHERGGIAIIPVYRFTVLFSKIGLHPALSLLMIVPGVNLIMRVVFYIFLARKFNRSYFWVPFLVLVPVVALPIVAFGEGHHIRVKVPKRKEKEAPKAEKKLEEAKPVEAEKPVEEKVEIEKIVEEEKKADEKKAEEEKKVEAEKPVEVEEPKEVEKPVEAEKPAETQKPVEVVVPVEAETKPEEPKQEKKEDAPKPVQKPATVKRAKAKPMDMIRVPKKKSDRMPTIKKGPKGTDIALEEQKAKRPKTEYEILLAKQKQAQERRAKNASGKKSAKPMDMIRVPKKKSAEKKSQEKPKKKDEGITIKFD